MVCRSNHTLPSTQGGWTYLLEDMKALSIKQPWASLIAHGIKPIENRTWKTSYRGPIYIHASAPKKFNVQMTDAQTIAALPVMKTAFDGTMPFGAIIGEVNIVDCVINHHSIWAEGTFYPIDESEGYMNVKPIYNWVLENAILYNDPIFDVKGKLSLWEFEGHTTQCGYCDKVFEEKIHLEYGHYGTVCGDCFHGLV